VVVPPLRPAALCALSLALLAPATAAGHGSASALPADAERALQAFEADVLGAAHAREHAAARRADARAAQAPAGPGFDPCRPRTDTTSFDPSRPLPPEGRPTGQARCNPTLPPQPKGAALARLGRWKAGVQDLPHYAIHAALLPTGRVLFYGFEWTQRIITRNADSHQGTSSIATVWSPSKGIGASALTPVPAPRVDVDGDGVAEPVPLYCSGQSFLPDGRVLVTGGTLDLRWGEKGYTNPPGLKIVLVFDPRTQTWSRKQDMAVARWYPTQAQLADGRTVVLGGYDDQKPTNLTAQLEVVSPDGARVTRAPQGDRETWTYPGLLLMPSSRVLLGGPRRQDVGLLDPVTLRWSAIPRLGATRGGENLVPVPTSKGSSPQAMMIGGANFEAAGFPPKDTAAYRTTLVFDDRTPSRGFRPAPSQHRPRNWPNTVLLPDGSMATFGGGTAITRRDGAYTSAPANRRVELWNPRTKRWTLGPAQREDRAYHSVALLLPDGRVWSAGDDANPNRDGDTAEVYEPPYLFKGARPRIAGAPKRLAPRRTFSLTVRGTAPRRVTMLAPSATTHGRDMNQRFVELRVLRRKRSGAGWRVTVRGPRSYAVAPRGPYMLFALSQRGAPSQAAWTRVG